MFSFIKWPESVLLAICYMSSVLSKSIVTKYLPNFLGHFTLLYFTGEGWGGRMGKGETGGRGDT